jgi:hypothetical protein
MDVITPAAGAGATVATTVGSNPFLCLVGNTMTRFQLRVSRSKKE